MWSGFFSKKHNSVELSITCILIIRPPHDMCFCEKGTKILASNFLPMTEVDFPYGSKVGHLEGDQLCGTSLEASQGNCRWPANHYSGPQGPWWDLLKRIWILDYLSYPGCGSDIGHPDVTLIQVDWSPLGQNGCHFADDIFKCIFVNEKFCISNWISLKFVPNGLIDSKSVLVQVMAWRRTGVKPLPEPMLT